jgi:hypothetical protein
MTAPAITIKSVSKYRISDEPGKDQSVVKFSSNQNIVAFEARAGGLYNGSGLLVGKSDNLFPSTTLYPSISLIPKNYQALANMELQFEVDNEELQQDGDYRINIYACNESGEWTPYG